MTDNKALGLIAGNGQFPFLLAREAKKQGRKVFAVAIKGDTSFLLRNFVKELFWIGPGDLKKMFVFFNEKDIREVIMAGQVSQRNLFDEKIPFDDSFKELFAALSDRKADTIFSAIARRLELEGMTLIDSTAFLKSYLAPSGILTKRSPSDSEREDIEFGRHIAKEMGAIDVGQTVVVKGKAIVAIEAMEGTDQTILRGGKIARKEAVVVKMSKPDQDNRFDIPVIGPKTIAIMKKSKVRCIAVEQGKTLMIDRERLLRLADQSGICIICI